MSLVVVCLIVAFIVQEGAKKKAPRDGGGSGAGVKEGGVRVTHDGLTPTSVTQDIVLSKNGITMVFAKRLAGAVYKMSWNGNSIIPELEGNGGSLQVALAFDIPLGESPEVENPTEAGCHLDNYGKTTSKWLEAASSASEVYTKSQMAYYYPPGQRVASSPTKTVARGSSPLSDVILKKRVVIGWQFPNVVNFSIDLSWTKEHHFTQIQILAVYLSSDFRDVYLAKNGVAVRHVTGDPNNLTKLSPPDDSFPLILAKNSQVAIGLYAHTIPKGGRFPGQQPYYTGNTTSSGHKDFGRGLQKVQLTPITAIFQAGDPANKATRIEKSASFGCCLVFGTVALVAETLHTLNPK